MKVHAHPAAGSARPRSAFAAAAAAAVLALWVPAPSHACGACVEDKVAAAYDHAVVKRAAARGDVVVFCEIGGALAGPLDAAHVKAAARAAPGVMPRSVRVSVQPAALSFAVDPRVQSPQAAILAVQRALGADTRLTIVQLLPSTASPAR
jgi:hypothetical protein